MRGGSRRAKPPADAGRSGKIVADQSAPSTGMNLGAAFRDTTRNAQRVLVIEPGMLGDALHLIPALWELRRSYPEAELHVLCSPVGAEVQEMAGVAHKLWVLPQARRERRLSEQLRVLRELRRRKFD